MDGSTSINIDGVTLRLVVERKRVRHINARLRQETLFVSAPAGVSQQILDQVVPDLARRLVRRVHARKVNTEEDALALVRKVAARFPNRPEVAHVEFVTTQMSRWGSYSSRTRTIRLHAALCDMPRWVLESVVAHELAHVSYLDHGPAFWALVRSVDPDCDRADGFLNGVSWLARNDGQLPPVTRALLQGLSGCTPDDGSVR
ncbi:MAG: M48 family metallopeptidase [Gemmataceae bacterium]|nr:M48 family metallopeptidase [Gemmataceae bacterium]